MEKLDTLTIKTRIGELTLFAQGDAVIALDWGQGMDAPRKTQNTALNKAAHILTDYFTTGQLDTSDLKLDPHGTAFQKRVWREMQKIKTGNTKTYGEIAKTLKSGPRAVGGACGANPIPILIPCHRIVAANGMIGHYSGGDGQETKQFLLRLEGAIS